MADIILSREQVREIDRRAIEDMGLPGVVLMENAGRGTAELLMGRGIAGPVVVCAGRGNNGGDGFVVARHLENHGYDVRVLLFCDPHELRGDAAVNYRVISAAETPRIVFGSNPESEALKQELLRADWIVDALLGTGITGEVREPYRAVIQAVNEAPGRVLAVDVPSGMDCDTGHSLGVCVEAEVTATFVAHKLGMGAVGARQWTGHVSVVDIGVPRILLTV